MRNTITEITTILDNIGNNLGDWLDIYNSYFANEAEQQCFFSLKKHLCDEAKTETIYPHCKNWFTAYKLTSPSAVKVVILGQDPYPGVGSVGHGEIVQKIPHAHGLSFSSFTQGDLPASLRNIYQEILRDNLLQADFKCNEELKKNDREANNNIGVGLSSWASEGVLLLNSVLTTRAGRIAAHNSFGWQRFTMHAIKHVATLHRPVVFMLWGATAASYLPVILAAYKTKLTKKVEKAENKIINQQEKSGEPILASIKNGNIENINSSHSYLLGNVLVLLASHPSPLSAYRGFNGCGHFGKANKFLMNFGIAPINWGKPILQYCHAAYDKKQGICKNYIF